jgi:plasmid stabilization system protein ParE
MIARLTVRREAQADLAVAFRWYQGQSPGLGFEFLRAVDACLASIQRSPLAYPAVHGRLRRAMLRKFPYGVFYLATGEVVSVLACLHAKRDPHVWRSRL